MKRNMMKLFIGKPVQKLINIQKELSDLIPSEYA